MENVTILKEIKKEKFNYSNGDEGVVKRLRFGSLSKSPITGNWIDTTLGMRTERKNFWPKRFVNNELVDNEVYAAVDSMIGEVVSLAGKTFITSPFNFEDDSREQPRKTFRVVVIHHPDATEAQINAQLLSEALYELRGLGVRIFDETGENQLGVSLTESELENRIAAYREKEKSNNAGGEANTGKNPVDYSKLTKKQLVEALKAGNVTFDENLKLDELRELALAEL